ncbi:MAG: hypothetical protein HN368_17670, partial [Spirochaetales bacterium]|nr:hypothetical protein [Spirochaetales bacterium]
MDTLREEAITFLEETTGREIRYSSVSPSVLRYLEINDMQILSEDGANGDLLSVTRIRIYYNIFKLLGKNPAGAFSRLSIEDTSVSIDLEADKDLLELLDNLLSQLLQKKNTDLNIVVSGRDLRVLVSSKDLSFAVNELSFDLDTSPAIPKIELRTEILADLSTKETPFERLSGEVKLNGTFSRDMSNATLTGT